MERISSGGATLSAAVTIIGPDGGRGVAAMRVGFVQDVFETPIVGQSLFIKATYSDNSTRYYGITSPPPGALDCVHSTLPYYDLVNDDGSYSVLFNPTNNNTAFIKMDDTPAIYVPVTQGSADVASIQYTIQLVTYVVVSSEWDLDWRGPDMGGGVYTALAECDWTVCYDGTFAPTTHTWGATTAKVSSPTAGFKLLADPKEPDYLTPPFADDVYNGRWY